MPYHCTYCKITWASLHSQDVGDEQYEYCPKCGNDIYLVETTEGDTHIFCPITGKIINVKTGKVLEQETKSNYVPPKPFDLENWKQKVIDFELKQDAALKEYQEIFESEGKAAAEKKYFEMMKK